MGICPTEIDDMEIYDIIEDLNRLDFVQSRACCSGHFYRKRRSDFNPYVCYDFSDQKKGLELTRTIDKKIRVNLEHARESKLEFKTEFRAAVYTDGDINEIKFLLNCFPYIYRNGGYPEEPNFKPGIVCEIAYHEGSDPAKRFAEEMKRRFNLNIKVDLYEARIGGSGRRMEIKKETDEAFWGGFREGIKEFTKNHQGI